MPMSYADYTAAVAAELAYDGAYRYQNDFQAALAFALKNSDGTIDMVDDNDCPR